MTYQIKSQGKCIEYNIEGLTEKSRNNSKERQDLLVEIVTRNPKILHTHIIKIAQHLGFKPKKTIENELNRLEEQGILNSCKLGTSTNAKRLWMIPTPERLEEKQLRNNLKELIFELSKNLKQLENTYEKMNRLEQITSIVCMLQTTSSIFVMYRYYSIIDSIESELNKLEELQKRLLELSFNVDMGTILQSMHSINLGYIDKFREIIEKYYK